MSTVADRQLVSSCCEGAAALGVREGMSSTEARTLIAGEPVLVLPFEPERDRRALEALAAWALRFSPVVAVDPPAGLLLDVGGCERMFGGERELLDAVCDAAEWLGIRVRAAIADTIGCAWALARCGRLERSRVPSGLERKALGPLPISALRVDEKAELALLEVGVERIEHLLRLERDELATRFGAQLLLRLDQALGRTPETHEPIRPAWLPRAALTFEGVVSDVEVLTKVVRDLLSGLEEQLEGRSSGALKVDLQLDRTDLAPLVESVVLSRPSRDARHLWSLISPRLEKAHLGFGVECVAVSAPRVGRILPEQEKASFVDPADRDKAGLDRALGELLDGMIGRFGPECTLHAEIAESWLPERAFAVRPLHGGGTSQRGAEAPRVLPFDRPTLLFEWPEPVGVLEAAELPISLRWRRSTRRVVCCSGPERIAEPWWEDASGCSPIRIAARDYYKVQDERGSWLWLFREDESERWFVHGEWA